MLHDVPPSITVFVSLLPSVHEVGDDGSQHAEENVCVWSAEPYRELRQTGVLVSYAACMVVMRECHSCQQG